MDKRSTLGAVAALAHATAKGCSSPQLQPQTQFAARLLAVDMLLHAFSSAHISNLITINNDTINALASMPVGPAPHGGGYKCDLMFDALGASCHDKRSTLGAVAALGHAVSQRLPQPATAAADPQFRSQAAGC